jgi:hypothetical protein
LIGLGAGMERENGLFFDMWLFLANNIIVFDFALSYGRSEDVIFETLPHVAVHIELHREVVTD